MVFSVWTRFAVFCASDVLRLLPESGEVFVIISSSVIVAGYIFGIGCDGFRVLGVY